MIVHIGTSGWSYAHGQVCFIPTSYRPTKSSIAIFHIIKQSKLIAPTTAEINSKTETTRVMIEKRRTIK